MLEKYRNIKIRVLLRKFWQTEEKAHITKFIVAFRNFANTSNRMVYKNEKNIFSSYPKISTPKMQAMSL